MNRFLSLGLLALPVFSQSLSPGCGNSPTLASGTHTLTVGDQEREFILTLPDGYEANNPYRLIFGFHWLGGSMEDVATGQTVENGTWSYYGLQRLAENSAIFVAPQGQANAWVNLGGVDTNFVDAMIETLEADLCVDQNLRFATGFSYGASMSYSLACNRASEFRAVAALSGGQVSGCDGGKDPIAYMGVHGLGDLVLPIAAGRALRDTFVAANGCTEQEAPEPEPGSLTHVKTEYEGCKEGYPVTWIAFDGDHIPAPYDGGEGDNGTLAYTPGETWSFFSQFS
ncbi:hypothetical protein AJ79_04591 [Helicocarpus griseus UAMH5409]|uniref:Feruloyl esterase C n=1 Tax=Helicocarpus griseus UAMH5409 TaxID=1447875 RepID=A0A2B7XSG2_9EURO|nr:hypothetical protein AJ79_04591 [Helicocarpus griseus UAMH5409]